jgi:hypothetical protein
VGSDVNEEKFKTLEVFAVHVVVVVSMTDLVERIVLSTD